MLDTIGRTFRYALVILPVTLAGGFSLGLLLSSKSKANVFFRTVLFAPYVTSMVAISSVWMFIFHPQYGALNSLLALVGIPAVRWLNETSTAFGCVAFVTMWRLLGYDTLVFIGGIQNISADVLEAATIDGANR